MKRRPGKGLSLEKSRGLASRLEAKHARLTREHQCVAAMLEAASEFGLEDEVVWEFYNALRIVPGMDICEAASVALGEWDLLSVDEVFKSIEIVEPSSE